MTSKHQKCCCGDCEICTDDFDRADEEPVTGSWVEAGSADWEIVSNELRMKVEGPLISTCAPPAPADSSYYTHIIECDLTGSTGPWKIICNYTDATNFDWVLLHYRTVGPSSGLLPIFYRRTSGSDSAVFDPETDYAANLFFILRPEDNGGSTQIKICYGKEHWTLTSETLASAQYDAECGDPAPGTTVPGGAGLVGFLAGPTDGSFDNFVYEIAWESDHDCENCSCMCYSSTTDYKCLPETLYLTLSPTSLDGNCPSSGPDIEWTLVQSTPVSTPSYPTAVTLDPYPEKLYWFSSPFEHNGIDGGCTGGYEVWWRLECIARGSYELALLEYPSGANSTPTAAVPGDGFQFVTQNGDAGGSRETDVDCGIDSATGVVRIDFGPVEKFLSQIGSGGPYNCCPLPDTIYDCWVDDVA